MHSNPLRVALLAVLSALVLLLAACGGDDGDSGGADAGPDPIEMAPSDVPFYAEVVVRPEGSLGDDLNSALSKLIDEDDPGAKITEAIDKEFADDPNTSDFTYADDIEPWLGSRAGIFVSGLQVDTMDPDAAAVVAVTDADAAQSFIDKAIESDPETTTTDESYEGVDYKLDEDGAAIGIDNDFLILSTEQAFKDAVDAGAGESLADNADATAALDDAPDSSVFSLYADSGAIGDLIKSSPDLSSEQLKQIDEQISKFGDGAIEAWGSVTDDSFTFAGSAPTGDEPPQPSDLITTFPADSWLAFASSDVGTQIEDQVAQLDSLFRQSATDLPPGVKAPRSQVDPLGEIEKQTGIDLEKDFAWIGDAGGFVEGTSLINLGAGLVLESTDDQQASAALDKLQAALMKSPEVRSQAQIAPNSEGDGFTVSAPPVTAELAVRDGKAVAGVGSEDVDSILNPDDTLDGSDRFGTAMAGLGDGGTPTFFLDFPPLLDLIESQGQTTEDPQYQQAAPYLHALDYVIAGSGTDGDRTTASFVLGVKESDSAGGSDVAPAVITP